MDRIPHVLVVPFPVQGHVTPLLKFAHRIADHGIMVTFVNTEFIHSRIMAGLPDKEHNRIELVSIPDGLEPDDDRKDIVKYKDSVERVMPGHLMDLIKKINHSNNGKVTCIIGDISVLWTQEIAKKIGVDYAAIWPGGPGNLALLLHLPKLIEAGYIDKNGTPTNNELISFSKEIPALRGSELPWRFFGDPKAEKVFFDFALSFKQTVETVNWTLCNTYYELDSAGCDLIPNILPIGPLLASDYPGHSAGSFWPEDSTCLSWLDNQPANSVIYVAFGSITIFSQYQFNELALGLELSGQPFLWVVRSDLTNTILPEFPDGFLERVLPDRGKIVQWAPQEKVLSHPSVACFFSHCGWNSTMEGLSMGVRFLCWPYFADQYQNQGYICEIWKVGIKLKYDEGGLVSRHEIKAKIEKLLSCDDMKTNALKLKEMARNSTEKGRSSFKNFESFIQHLKF